jgi:hypothetical protein
MSASSLWAQVEKRVEARKRSSVAAVVSPANDDELTHLVGLWASAIEREAWLAGTEMRCTWQGAARRRAAFGWVHNPFESVTRITRNGKLFDPYKTLPGKRRLAKAKF